MKGLLYGNFLLNKSWFIISGIVMAVGVFVTAVLCNIDPGSGVGQFGLTITEVVVITICVEWLGRNLESNLKSRFADYALAGGISKGQFVTSELLKNLISIGIGFAMCVVTQLVLNVFDRGLFSLENVRNAVLYALFVGAVEWICAPVVINLKSAEKAGLLVGIVLGFGVVMPVGALIMIFLAGKDETLGEYIMRVFAEPWFGWAFVGVCAAIYAIFYFVLLRRVKRGDVC